MTTPATAFPIGSATRIADAAQAEALVASIAATMTALQDVLQAETAGIKEGRIAAALADQARKTALAGDYMKGLEAIKANALAVARFAPAAMTRLKTLHEEFNKAIALNQAVLATAHAVSEGLMRSLAAEAVNAVASAAGYAPPNARVTQGQTPGPLAVSRSA